MVLTLEQSLLRQKEEAELLASKLDSAKADATSRTKRLWRVGVRAVANKSAGDKVGTQLYLLLTYR